MCKVRCWRWLSGNKLPTSEAAEKAAARAAAAAAKAAE